MSKVYMVSTAFVPARIAIPSVQQINKTIGINPEWFIWHNGYPIDRALNDELLRTLFRHQLAYQRNTNGENVGLSQGLNNLITEINPKDDDIILATDLDVYPITQNWGQAIVDVLRADPTVGWVSLQNQHSKRELSERGYTVHTIGGHICHEGHTAAVQSIVGWSGRSLKGLNGLKEQNLYYGGMEVISWPRLKALGLKWVYLPAFEEQYDPKMECEGPYRHYKWNYAHLKTTTLDFASWLAEDPSRLELK